MITLEQVEQLRTKADVTYEEARQALEAANGDLLDAVILLELQGKVKPPVAAVRAAREQKETRDESKQADTGSATADSSGAETDRAKNEKKGTGRRENQTDAGSVFKTFFAWVKRQIHAGNRNNFVVMRGDRTMLTLPITALVLLTLFFFWAIIVLIVIGLFCGFRYSFAGPDIRGDAANTILHSAADAAETLRRDVGAAINKDKPKDI